MKKRANMQIATFVVVFAIAAGLVVPTTANDRPSDPFGGYTTKLNKDAPIAQMWDLLRDKMLIEKGYFHKCLESKDCPSILALVQRLDEIRQYRCKALLGHLNIVVNLMVTPALAIGRPRSKHSRRKTVTANPIRLPSMRGLKSLEYRLTTSGS